MYEEEEPTLKVEVFPTELPGEETLVEFWLRATHEVVELTRGLSDEDLARLSERWDRSTSSFAVGLGVLVQEITAYRRLHNVDAPSAE